MMWSGFEPAEGQINETYTDIIYQIVDGLSSRGIYSYLDMHQVGPRSIMPGTAYF
jgi:hypothetical protein